MKLMGGYDILLEGRPSKTLQQLPEPKELFLSLHSRRFLFNEICVKDGQNVSVGEVLAKDSDNYTIPLLAPRSGRVRLNEADGQIVLTDLQMSNEKPYIFEEELPHIAQQMDSAGMKRYKLLALGAWQFFNDAYTGRLPDPLSIPQAVIVSTVNLEPYLVRGDILLKEYLSQFTRGLEHLQSLLEYQPIYLAFPKISTDFAAKIKEKIRGYAWVKLIEVPLIYPYDNFEILSRHIGLKRGQGDIWGVNVEGVLAIDNVLTASRPCVERVISVAGPGVEQPLHLRLVTGYPISKIRDEYALQNTIAIDGGILTGRLLTDDTKGVSCECKGITFIEEHQRREFLAFVRPGFDRQSYSNCFLSSLYNLFLERQTNAVRGELRPCVSCGFCEEVCPAGIIPHRLHKLIYQDHIDEIERSRIDLCIECGLCSFVCPSKIELMDQFQQMKQTILEEKAIAAADASKEASSELQPEAE